MQENTNCLGEDDLLLLAVGGLDGATRERAEAHIDRCGACRTLVAVAANPDANGGSKEAFGVFETGDVVAGRYQITRLLGRGGMGEVYEALDITLSERVALKTIGVESPLDSQGIARLKAEVQLARRVTHPNVCRVFDVGFHRTRALTAGGEQLLIPFLTMELLDGETLRSAITGRGRLEPAVALDVVTQMAAGLDAAHGAGIVHADLKADNVILAAAAAGTWRVVITDFGLARRYRVNSRSSSISQKLLGGTVGYIAPEHLEGRRPSPAGDIYSLGVVLFEMLTGALPFPATSPLAAAVASVNGTPPPLRDRVAVPDSWDQVIRRCLDPRPERRFQRAAEMVAALRSPARGRVRKRNLLVLSGGLLLSSVAAISLLHGGAGGADRARPSARETTPVSAADPPPAGPTPPEPRPAPVVVSPAEAPVPPEKAPAPRSHRRRSVGPALLRKSASPPVPSLAAPAIEEPGDDDAIDPF